MGYPARFIARNVFDLATLTTTIAPYATTPVDNLKNPRRARIARWPAAGGTQSIKGTWNGQGFVVGGGALDRFNLEGSATVRFRGFANADWTGATLIDTTTVAPYNITALDQLTWGVDPLGKSIFDGYQGYKFWPFWVARQTIYSFQFDIIDTGNSWQVIDLSRAILGDYLETTYNAKFGARAGWKESTAQDESDGGSLFSDARLPRRSITGALGAITPAERATVYNLLRFVGKRKAFLVTFQAGEGATFERDFTIPQAKFTDLPDIGWETVMNHEMPFTLVEA